MCILCVVQKWSRRVATMLPWLVIPLVGLWALSQILPPAFRFEITSPRLACVFVLLVTLFWYEILMPQLSAWRVRRNALLRERKRFEAIELHKMRKTATRRCRNCFTAYKDQNPGGGRFMCLYCGHISKRPVLDLPVPPGGVGISNSGIIRDLVGKGGKILNGKGWPENGWMCGQDWLENGNWVGGPIAGKSNYWRKNENGIFGDENCLAEKSYSGVVFFACRLLKSFFLSIRWLWRKVFRISSSREDAASDAEHRTILAKRGENGANYHESRGEKARRKAEEKRQARLEKELLEEEERKQREEVARLVEERRRLRDEKMEAEKEHGKTTLTVKEKDSKREAERKRQERRKDKDKLSSKSNSDVEELEKRAGKENEWKRDFDKKSENDRHEHQKSGADINKGHGGKNSSTNNYNRGNAGTRYLDRMKGTFLYSSKAFSGGSLFGNGADTSAIAKENKSNSSVDHFHPTSYKKDFYPSERGAGKIPNGDDKNISRPVLSEPQSRTTPKKSWQQLFTRSPSVPPMLNANVISRPNPKFSTEAQNPPLPAQSSSIQTFDNPLNFGLPSPFTLSSFPNVSASSSLVFSPVIEPVVPQVGDGPHEFILEETEHFEDPCYDPDPISLLGPVSESLDNFQLDLGNGFATDTGLGRSHALKDVRSSEGSKPSPIEAPLSRLKVADDKPNKSNWFPSTPKAQDTHTFAVDDANATEKGTWQMWSSTPLGQEGLAMVGGPPGGWILPPEQNRSNKEDFVHLSSQQTMASLFTKEEPALPGNHSPQKGFFGSGQNGGTFSPVTSSTDHDPWIQNAFFPPLSGNNRFSTRPAEDSTKNEMIFGSPTTSATDHSFENSQTNCWSKKDWTVQGKGETVGKSSISRPCIGGLFCVTPDVQSLW